MGYKNDDPCIKKAYPDERLFVLMARDPAAVDAIIQWIGVSVAMQPAEKLHEALDCAIEMSKRCDEFRKRKEEDEKKKIAAQERDEFDRWKKMKDGKGPLTPFPNNEAEHAGDAIKYGIDFAREASPLGKYASQMSDERAINFAKRFADYLDNNLPGQTGLKGFNARMLEEFVKTLPSQ